MNGFLLGVDEAGRGPLAGPVSVGVVIATQGFDIREEFPGINDSKKLSEKKREVLYALLQNYVTIGILRYKVIFKSAEDIDTRGIVVVIKEAVWEGVRSLISNSSTVELRGSEYRVLLDGSLSAPPEYMQETIVHGDSLEPIISLASIVAKVERDHLMCVLALQYPNYGFEVHKGYGTKRHIDAIQQHGLSAVHRTTFCSALLCL